MARPRLKDLDGGALFSTPKNYDWNEHACCGEEWEHYDVAECGECGATVTAFYSWECPKCGREVDPAEGPMMNYYYPLPEFSYVLKEHFGGGGGSLKRAALEIAKAGPLCLVEIGNDYALALTGGGMDLSWEICHAYILAGYLPPLHFHDLPHMCGYNERPMAKLVVGACLKAARVARLRVARGITDLLRLRAWVKEGEQARKERKEYQGAPPSDLTPEKPVLPPY